jgi:nucleotide-binding universal stress UspA family protein
LALSTHGRSGLAHVLLGSVAEAVIRAAPCDVLAARPIGLAFKLP